MKPAPRWVSKKALLLLHEENLAQFGGARGLADEGLLDSALVRPLNTYAYKPESTVADLAASYAYGLARNHAGPECPPSACAIMKNHAAQPLRSAARARAQDGQWPVRDPVRHSLHARFDHTEVLP